MTRAVLIGATGRMGTAIVRASAGGGIDIVAASVLRAQEHGYAAGLQPEHTALAIALLFEQFTTVCLRPDSAGLGLRLSDNDAVTTLSTIWKKTLYGF